MVVPSREFQKFDTKNLFTYTTLNIAYGKNHATNGFCIEILT